MTSTFFACELKAFYTDPTPLTLWEKVKDSNGIHFMAYLLRTNSWTHCIGLDNFNGYFDFHKTINIEAESRDEVIYKYQQILLIHKLSK